MELKDSCIFIYIVKYIEQVAEKFSTYKKNVPSLEMEKENTMSDFITVLVEVDLVSR